MTRPSLEQMLSSARQRVRTRAVALLRGARVAAVNAVVRPEHSHVVCPECSVDFVPELVGPRCPICGWAVESAQPARPVRSADRRLTAGLGFAWFAGAVIFALVAHFLYA
jgi:hypothetical protein